MTATTNGIDNSNSLAENAQKLLDFNQKLDIDLLDQIVTWMYSKEGQQQRAAQVRQHISSALRHVIDLLMEWVPLKYMND